MKEPQENVISKNSLENYQCSGTEGINKNLFFIAETQSYL